MRRSLPFLVLLLASTAACNRTDVGPSNRTAETANSTDAAGDMMEAPVPGTSVPSREGGPDIGTTAAPDVAFDYRYGFRLAADRIAQVQDQHQLLCERYTLARCRITGMTYRAAGQGDVEASMSFALDPAVARQFGHDAVQRVTAADGSVTESAIEGNEVGPSLRATGRTLSELQSDLERIELRLSGLDSGSALKSGLEEQAAELRAQIRSLRESRGSQAESLAMTPMIFRYGSGSLAPGPDQQPTLSEAAADMGESAMYGLYLLARVLIALAPWAGAALILWLVVRFLRRRLSPRPAGAAVESEAI
ncbi:MAG TPA: hypothetical protein VIT38_04670 [Allosphingosinicella sp.]